TEKLVALSTTFPDRNEEIDHWIGTAMPSVRSIRSPTSDFTSSTECPSRENSSSKAYCSGTGTLISRSIELGGSREMDSWSGGFCKYSLQVLKRNATSASARITNSFQRILCHFDFGIAGILRL